MLVSRFSQNPLFINTLPIGGAPAEKILAELAIRGNNLLLTVSRLFA
jgi:hypothetical protein